MSNNRPQPKVSQPEKTPTTPPRIQGWVVDGKVNGDRVPVGEGRYRVAAFNKPKGWNVNESEFKVFESGSFVLADYEGRYVLAEELE